MLMYYCISKVNNISYLCIPEHSIQSVMPRLILAHLGSPEPQSQQWSLPGIDNNCDILLKIHNKSNM